jgi:photosystem II stability/assembly factor-like uncharacterized protein
MRKQLALLALLFIVFHSLSKIQAQPTATPADARLKGFEQRKALKNNSLLAPVNPVNIGPSVFSCRITDLDANPADPTEIYVAYASGGLWHSTSNGTQFKPIFDHEASMTIGDIAVDWTNRVLWVGTGEANSSRSSYAGTGLYRSADNGKTWEWRGLAESHHIARIVLHPTDPNTLWVAVLGHLYSPNTERGVFKTTDGGRTWAKTLFVNENSGGIDLVLDPSNPQNLYAATWERSRRAWDFDGAGEGSGIWKSSDGGTTWAKSSTPASGFPTGANVGRIGLAAGKKNGKTVLYACLDNQNSKPKKDKPAEDVLTKDQLRPMLKEDFLKLPDERLSDFLKQNDFPEKYTAKKVKELISNGKLKPLALVEYLEDANNNLFETDYIGAELYRSEDGGKTWQRTHEEAIEQMHFTYGYYFSNVRCAPNDADQVYMIGFYIIRSEDGGKTWKNINGDNVHVDHHALWLNPARPGHLLNGNDGGLNISWDNGESWAKCNTPPVGQFYAVATDRAKPYRVYAGAQDNGVWVGPNNYQASTEWHQTGHYPYKEIIGGDGMQIQVDFRDNNTVYTGFQFGNYFRFNQLTGKSDPITPKHELGERPLRFNWQTPIWLSRHQQDVLYFGANKLYRSFNQGRDWEAISGDLTQGGKTGNVPYGTLTSICESPLKFGLLYAGSDDGLLHVTRDGGETWAKISDELPQNMWVSRVIASQHARERVYAALSGYRWDDFGAYLYVSENYGKTWMRIGVDLDGAGEGLALPDEPINVVKEDPANPNVLYVGTDHNLYVSLDRGRSFQALSADFPDVPVHDLDIQQDASELVIGTHGRSMFKADISRIQKLDADVLGADMYVFELDKRKFSKNWGKKQPYKEAKDPELPIWFFAKSAGKATWTIAHKESGLVLNAGSADCVRGLNEWKYTLDLRESELKKYRETLQAAQKDAKKPLEIEKADTGKLYLQKGVYTFAMTKNGVTSTRELTIE